MEKLIQSIPESFVSLVGFAVVMGALIMLGTFFQEWTKKIIRDRHGAGRRDSDLLLERFLEIQQESAESNRRVAEELRGFSENIATMTRGMERRSNQALEQHDQIMDKIDDLDIPRKARHY